MSSGFANRRKPRKVGGADEDNDEGEQGKPPHQSINQTVSGNP